MRAGSRVPPPIGRPGIPRRTRSGFLRSLHPPAVFIVDIAVPIAPILPMRRSWVANSSLTLVAQCAFTALVVKAFADASVWALLVVVNALAAASVVASPTCECALPATRVAASPASCRSSRSDSGMRQHVDLCVAFGERVVGCSQCCRRSGLSTGCRRSNGTELHHVHRIGRASCTGHNIDDLARCTAAVPTETVLATRVATEPEPECDRIGCAHASRPRRS